MVFWAISLSSFLLFFFLYENDRMLFERVFASLRVESALCSIFDITYLISVFGFDLHGKFTVVKILLTGGPLFYVHLFKELEWIEFTSKLNFAHAFACVIFFQNNPLGGKSPLVSKNTPKIELRMRENICSIWSWLIFISIFLKLCHQPKT